MVPNKHDPSRLERICQAKGVKMTGQRRLIARVLSDSEDHPDVEQVYRRAFAIDSEISMATVYRTVRLFETAGVIERRDFGDGRARYEAARGDHHHHLIDLDNGKVIEFRNAELEGLIEAVALELGYRLEGIRLELYGMSAPRSAEEAHTRTKQLQARLAQAVRDRRPR
ncbi:MAG: transcriptional repressor [Azospirillum sp.]|nr:transcriptional repressor [Azospirillum sp.]